VNEFLKRGVNVALGTDSLASNPDLDPLQEACFLRQINDEISGELLLKMITLNGARALGRDQEFGSILPDRPAKLIAVELPNRDEADPHELLFRPGFPRAARRKRFRAAGGFE
jgi:cytosine/adenosine deaminase-related metal-dependent hydrolase